MNSEGSDQGISEAVQVVKIDYVGLSDRLGRLETFRDEHEKTHDQHVATQAWVYRQALIAIAAAATIGGTIGGAIIRAAFG